MSKNPLVAPVLKWVGGKRQLFETFKPLFPKKLYRYTYCEPFLGGGAIFFKLQPAKAHVNDINEDLMLVYTVIRDDVDNLIEILSAFTNDAENFYTVRDLDRNKKIFSRLSDLERAARIIFLNKTCFNGLYRVNNAGEFNTPFGNYRNPNIVNAPTLLAVSKYLNSAKITLTACDYSEVLLKLKKNSFVYLDPPYDPISATSNFTGYVKSGFNRDEQIRLRDCCDELTERGIKFMLSNSDTEFIREIYSSYNITPVKAKRAVNSVASKRGDVDELVIRNYD
ncbi:MAG: DNA adenine methylase [Selenomonadaceae bacterium]|nr:DNA adenine methylase [Selenomonadaceae bacterium]